MSFLRWFRVPAVYLTWANPVFLAFFSFNRINNLRVFSIAFSSIPTGSTTGNVGQGSGFVEDALVVVFVGGDDVVGAEFLFGVETGSFAHFAAAVGAG